MQLYQSRNFSAFFQDTFAFIKHNGKHFFKHFFIINGGFLLVLMIFGYFFMEFYTEVVFGSMLQNDPNAIDRYIDEHGGLFILVIIIFTLVALIFSLIMYVYPALYLKLYIVHNGKDFGTKDLINSYKSNIGKLFTYLFSGILIAIPLLFILGILIFVLFITIIGLLLMPVVIGAFALFYVMALMEYLENKRGVWDSFGYSWKLMSSKFWPAVGSVGLFYLMSYLIQNIVGVIAYIFGFIKFFTVLDQSNPDPSAVMSSLSIVMIVVFIAGILLGAFLNNVVLLNQGIVFYSLKEEHENINTKSAIDQIGTGD